MIDLNIAITNPQDLPSGKLVADISYSGWRVRTSGDTEMREAIRFHHLGLFEISEDGRVHPSVPDFVNDPVLIRAVQLGILEMTVDEDRGRHTLGHLVFRDGSTDSTRNEANLNQINIQGIPTEGGLPVASEYPTPVRLHFQPPRRR